MPDFVIKQQPYDLSQHAGLDLIGEYLKLIDLNTLVDPASHLRGGHHQWWKFQEPAWLSVLGKENCYTIKG